MLVKNYSIQLKAALLLLVFALNTVVGFACAVGVDMGFNTGHHPEEAPSVHVHSDGKKHIHNNTSGHDHHDKSANHQHNAAANSNHPSKNGKDNCCNDKVIKLAQGDKALSPSLNIAINPVFITAYIGSFYHIDLSAASQATKHIKYFVQGHHPPIPDIRIAIRSFQI